MENSFGLERPGNGRKMTNRRRYQRLETDLPANLSFEDQDISECRIRNFSEGGVYLHCGDSALNELLYDGYIPQPDRREAMLSIGSNQVRIAIVYKHNHGIGGSIVDPEQGEVLYDYLQSQRKTESREQASLDKSVVAPVIELLQKHLHDFLKPLLNTFFSQSKVALLEHVNDSQTNQQESELILLMAALEREQADISVAFLGQVEKTFDDLAILAGVNSTPSGSLNQELELVDKVEIDQWVVINDIARQVEAESARNLYHIETSLTYLTEHTIKGENNPFSPISLLHALKHTLERFDLEINGFYLVLSVFQRTVLKELDSLYEGVVALFKQKGIDFTSQYQSDTNQTHYTKKIVHPNVGKVLQHLSSLFDVKHHANLEEKASEVERVGKREVLESLNNLPLRFGSSVLKQLEHELSNPPSGDNKLDPMVSAAISTGEELVSALRDDPLIPSELKDLLNRMEIQIIQEVVNDPSLLENSKHPVRQLLATIESLAPYLTVGHLMNQIREMSKISQLLDAIDCHKLSSVSDVTQALENLKHTQLEKFHRNRQLAIEHCKKKQQHIVAESEVYKYISQQFLSKSISCVIERLFQFGWINLLIQTYAIEGKESTAWKAYSRVLEILEKLFPTTSTNHDMSESRIRDLISLIRKGFRDYPVYPEDSRAFAVELQTALLRGGEAARHFYTQRVLANEGYLAQFFSDKNIKIDDRVVSEVDQVSLNRVKSLKLDTWMVADSDKRMIFLAWKNSDSSRFLFVDGNGMKTLDVTDIELAKSVISGDYTVVQDRVQPIVDRAIDRILLTSFNQIKDESSFDLLTGLLNRRGFERQLHALSVGEETTEKHVLVLLDLDKFHVVNDLCGLEGGDQLLQTVSSILSSYLTEGSLAARIGDDEFALLIKNADLDAGYQNAESLRRAIKEYNFSWNDRLIPVSASFGVVLIDVRQQANTSELLQAAKSACHMAKEAGRNCTRLFSASDTAYQKHMQIIQTIPTIQEALTNDRMVLYAQPIVPLKEGAGLTTHYEILLRILDDRGRPQAPQSFIKIAEQYDLMRAVDRWVIDHFFEAIMPFEDGVLGEVGFSVNLSTKSVVDREFERYLKQCIIDSPVAAEQIGFEVTETALARDIEETVAFMNEVRSMGCSCYLDDFGSGFASFSYLKDFPVNFVKIDGIFVREMIQNTSDLAMVISIMELAHFMDKMVIAEHVSDASIGKALREMGVDYAQGYHFGRPRPFSDVLQEIVGVGQQLSSA
jgi:diguanylate cyclase (GGDEF)-like protein